jgi:uncharacterized membrane protein (UPF0127 family)
MRVIFFLSCLCLIPFAACNAAEGKPQTGLPVQVLTIETAAGNSVRVEAELARTDVEQSIGLMWRKSLAFGAGMLFVYGKDQIMSFWMKNTLIPLSIAFIASDGRILEIYDMERESLRVVRSTRSARYALEVPQGFFTRAGIGVGDRLTHAPTGCFLLARNGRWAVSRPARCQRRLWCQTPTGCSLP